MPIKAAQFDPASPATNPVNATATTFNVGKTGNVRFVMWNASPNDILISWGSGNGQSDLCPAWQARLFCIAIGQSNLEWVIDSTLSTSATPPASLIKVFTYAPSEIITDSFPISIQHQVSLGSGVNVISANNVSNTNLPAGSIIVFGIPVNDTNPPGTTIIYNSGEIILGDAAYLGTLSLITNGGDSFLLQANGWTQTDSTGTNVSIMSDTGILSLGNSNHGGSLQITGTTLASLTINTGVGVLIADTTGTTVFNSGVAGDIVIGNANHNGRIQLENTAGDNDIDLNAGYVGANGTVSGFIHMFQFLRGKFSIIVIIENNYHSTANTLVLPVALATNQLWIAGGIGTTTVGGYQVTLSGVTKNFDIITALAAAGGTTSNNATLFQFSIAFNNNGWDTLQVLTTGASAHNAVTLVVGF